MRRTIAVVDYDPAWAEAFRELAGVIAAAVGERPVRIEHIGSTSVPGLAAKPIVDIVVISRRADLPAVIARLAPLGYEHQGDGGIAERESFRRESTNVPRDGSARVWSNHYLYVCDAASPELARQIAFRDYLRAHPEAATAYSNLKKDLAARFPHDIGSYIAGKGPFIEEVLRQG